MLCVDGLRGKKRMVTPQSIAGSGPSLDRRSEEPGPLAPAQVTRHRRLLGENALRPFARLSGAVLRCKKGRIIEVGFGQSGFLRSLLKKLSGFPGFSGVCVSVGQQACGAVR